MSAQHTPGPWGIAQPGSNFQKRRVEVIGLSTPTTKVCSVHDQNARVNARLIASAPELLRACELAAQWMHDNCEDDEPLRTIRAAIAKATGGAA